LLLGGEAAAQCSGSLDIDKNNVLAIFLRGKARMIAEDFKGAKVDLLEAKRRMGAGGDGISEVHATLKELECLSKEALERERELWSGEDKYEMSRRGFTFLGEESKYEQWFQTCKYAIWNHPRVLISIFIIFFCICAYNVDISQVMKAKRIERGIKSLKKYGLEHLEDLIVHGKKNKYDSLFSVPEHLKTKINEMDSNNNNEF